MTGKGRLSHLGEDGQMHMVDVSAKPPVARRAVARGRLVARPETIAAMTGGEVPKGDVAAAARLAGIMAAKRTSEIIPLCHPLPLDAIDIDIAPDQASGEVRITASVATSGRTGVEMEALTAVSVAALTLWDMLKGVDDHLGIEGVELVEKHKAV